MPHRCFRNQLALLQTFKVLQPGRRASPIDTAISDISRNTITSTEKQSAQVRRRFSTQVVTKHQWTVLMGAFLPQLF